MHDDTRRLRRLLRASRSRSTPTLASRKVDAAGPGFCSPPVSRRGYPLVHEPQRPGPRRSHPERRHQPPPSTMTQGGYVGVDRGLAAFAVAATAARDGGRPLPRSPSHCSMAIWRAYGGGPERSSRAKPRSRNHVQGDPAAVPTARPDQQAFAEASCMRSPASSSRLTTGSVWKTSPSPTSSATSTWPAPSATPPGPSSLARSATRRPGSGPSWSSATAGFHQPRPALGAGWSSNRWG